MPVYDYLCEAHGAFQSLRPMASYADPCPCPECDVPAQRVLLTAPRLAASDRGRMAAHAVNERSADAPRQNSAHGAGCSCCGPKRKSARAAAGAEAVKGFPSRRPWMISH